MTLLRSWRREIKPRCKRHANALFWIKAAIAPRIDALYARFQCTKAGCPGMARRCSKPSTGAVFFQVATWPLHGNQITDNLFFLRSDLASVIRIP
jgi:hypothetical protein